MSHPRVVVCFDRDEAVSTNPHPDPEKPAVPLSWVKYLAHGDGDVDVWATGNQTLRHEAAIPGTDRALALWSRLDSDAVSHLSIPDPHRFELPRRDRLHVIADLYDQAATGFVVVDDADITDMAAHGWTHFLPWAFVRAVETDDAPVEIPDDHGYSDEPWSRGDVGIAGHYDPTRA